MTPALFLVDELPAGERYVLSGDEGRHAAKVRRIGVGETLTLSDGNGALADCEVTAVVPEGLQLKIVGRRRAEAPSPRLIVVQALPKGDRAELAVETMTELGVDEIIPWAASRSVVHWHGERGAKAHAKWQRVAREAAKQSRRPWVPTVAPLATTTAIAKRMVGSTGIVLHEAASEPFGEMALPTEGELLIVVGPEGGISDDELAVFESGGGVAVRLGESVLRTSTAGPAALAALSLRLGRWS